MALQAGALAGLLNLGSVAPDYAGMGLNYLGTGLLTGNWGGTSKERKNQIHDIRTLRRREYQDMVHSLTEAGLNPILAVGASPGHATAQQVGGLSNYQTPPSGGSAGVGSAMAAHRVAGVSEKKAPSQINLANQTASATQLGIPNILQQWDLTNETIQRVRQDTRTQGALQGVYEQDAINKGASAREIEQRMRNIDKYGPPGASIEGMIRELLTPKQPGSSAKGLMERFMSGPSNAEKSSSDGAWRPPSLSEYMGWKK